MDVMPLFMGVAPGTQQSDQPLRNPNETTSVKWSFPTALTQAHKKQIAPDESVQCDQRLRGAAVERSMERDAARPRRRCPRGCLD